MSKYEPCGLARGSSAALWLAAMIASWAGASGPARASPPVTVVSLSRQFVIHGQPPGAIRSPARLAQGAEFVELEPRTLAVSCERIKAALLKALGAEDRWRSTISLRLQPVVRDGQQILVESVRYADMWRFRMVVPELAARKLLTETLVNVLLLEIANRHAGNTTAELPPWLAKGLTAHLQMTALDGFLPGDAANGSSTYVVAPEREAVGALLRFDKPLSFEELSWPADGAKSVDRISYALCSQLLVSELLRLDRGRSCLQDMLTRLPTRLNWQTAFLEAFSAHFEKLRDVEKWWALVVVQTSGQSVEDRTGFSSGLDQLAELLKVQIEVRQDKDRPPIRSETTLQTVVQTWDTSRQGPALVTKINALQLLAERSRAEVASLAASYRQVLAVYYDLRTARVRASDARGARAINPKLLVRQTVEKLDHLDAQRVALHARLLSRQP